jgi:cell division protein FtsQ
MWDRPDLLNRTSNALVAIAVLLALFGAGWYLVHLPQFALRELEVTGEAGHVTRAQVDAIMRSEVQGTFFTLNLPRLRVAFSKLPWVREVSLRRRWPAKLEVSIVEHVPLARWGNVGLVNTHGEVFAAAYDGNLPIFLGPSGTSKEIAIQYDFFRRQLAAVDAKPVMVQVTPRRAWQVRLENGPTIELGRDDVEARLARYIAVHERTVGLLKRRVAYVDLRYTNGFAVRIAGLKAEPEPGAKTVKPAARPKKVRAAALRTGRPAAVEAERSTEYLPWA